MTTILIADDHDVVRFGLRAFLRERPGWEVVAEAADGKEAVAQAMRTTPDVAIIDYSLPVLNGVEVTKQIRQHSPNTAVLIFTMHDNSNLVHDFLQAGALGYVLKTEIQHLLVSAVDTVAQHKPFFTGMTAEASLHAFRTKGRASPLTARERCVVKLIAEGNTNKEIAAMLGLSIKTIEHHRNAAHQKLKLHSPAELVRYAIRNEIAKA